MILFLYSTYELTINCFTIFLTGVFVSLKVAIKIGKCIQYDEANQHSYLCFTGVHLAIAKGILSYLKKMLFTETDCSP